MTTPTSKTIPIRSGEDVVLVRQAVRDWSIKMGFSLIEQTKLVTAASELARNTLEHGGGGNFVIDEVTAGSRRGLTMTFQDEGKGIPDIAMALKDGFTTGGGLGLGLGGAKRLLGDLEIQSEPGKGTMIRGTRWK